MPATTRKKAKGRRGGEIAPYLRLDRDVLESDALMTLPTAACFRLFLAFCAQHFGSNNGSIRMTFADAKRAGITSKRYFNRALAELLERGLIVRTRIGARPPMRRPALYALAWKAIDPPLAKDPHDATPGAERREYLRWKAEVFMGPPLVPVSAPTVVPINAVSAPTCGAGRPKASAPTVGPVQNISGGVR